VVDNTNMDKLVRSRWIQVSREEGASIRCIVLDVPKDVCQLLYAFRLLDPRTPPEDRREFHDVSTFIL
jgi:hypothetical protein